MSIDNIPNRVNTQRYTLKIREKPKPKTNKQRAKQNKLYTSPFINKIKQEQKITNHSQNEHPRQPKYNTISNNNTQQRHEYRR